MPRMSRSFARALIAVVALAHATFFIIYQSPDWLTQWTDQAGYTRLGDALATTGRFTRYPIYPPIHARSAPHARLPGVRRRRQPTLGPGSTAGRDRASRGVRGDLPDRLRDDTTRCQRPRRLAAGLATALYPPLPYFVALTLTEVFTTFLVTAAVVLVAARAARRRRLDVAAGIVLDGRGVDASQLPVSAAWPCRRLRGLIAPRSRIARRRSLRAGSSSFVGVTPWIVYNVIYFSIVSLVAAGWRESAERCGKEPGRSHCPGTRTRRRSRISPSRRGTVPLSMSEVRAYAASERISTSNRCCATFISGRTSAECGTTPQDPWERAAARVAADHEYGRLALDNIRRDPDQHIWRRADSRRRCCSGSPRFPVRYSDINALPTIVIRLIWFAQALLMARGDRRPRRSCGSVAPRAEAAAFAALLVYITAVHAVLFSEARYALPAKPMVVAAGDGGGVAVLREDSEPIVLTVVAAGQRWLAADRLPPSQSQTDWPTDVRRVLWTPGSGRPLG